LRLKARRSNSSPLPVTGSRPVRSPAMMVFAVPVMASTRRSTRRLTNRPPRMPSTMTIATDQRPASATMRNIRSRPSRSPPLALGEIAADQDADAAGQAQHPDQRVVLRRFRILQAAIGGLDPPLRFQHAGLQRTDIAGKSLPDRRGDEVETRPGTARAHFHD